MASAEDQRAAIDQANRDATAVAEARDKAPWKPQPMNWGPVLALWRAASRAQRIAISAILLLAPIMIITIRLHPAPPPQCQHGSLQTCPDDVARIMSGMKLNAPNGIGNGVVPVLNPSGKAAQPENGYHLSFQVDPAVEGIGFNDILGVPQGAVVCDEEDEAAKTGKGRLWILIADSKASDIRDKGDHFLVDGRTIAKKLSLDLDGHIVTPTEYSIMTTTDGRTLLTGAFFPEETFHAAFKNAQHMELSSGERTLAMDTSGHEALLTHVASQCTSLGMPF